MEFHWSFFNDFFKGYIKSVGLFFLGLYSTITSIIVAIVYISFGNNFSDWPYIFTVTIMPSIILSQGIIFYKIAKRLLPGERIENCLVQIAKMRERGVNELYNYEGNITTENDLTSLKEKFEKWHASLIPCIEQLSPSQAAIFRVLGTVTFEMPDKLIDEDAFLKFRTLHTLAIIRDYNDRLREMVDKFSLQNLSNRVQS